MLAEGKGAEAVLRLEDVIEQAGPRVTLTQYLLLAQALMSRQNYVRAEQIVYPLAEQFKDNPSVLLMASGVAVATGEPIVALRMLNHIVTTFPAFADAYVNLAYLHLAMDPAANRQGAIAYYREALRLGAEGDPRLERELNISIRIDPTRSDSTRLDKKE
jgi:tetratricopeptide (TPR) repeat protein